MGRARGGRVRASPPFCESITRSRWVGSCYSGASTPSPAGLLCVQWTGKHCLAAPRDGLLALQLPPRRRPGLFGAAARASLRLRPGSRAPPGSLPSAGLGRGRAGGCRGLRGGRRLRAVGEGAGRAQAPLASGLRAPRRERTRRPRGPSRFPSAPRVRARARTRQASRAQREPCGAPYPLPARRRAPAPACAAPRGPAEQCACAAFPAARTLPAASPARRGPGRGPETPPSSCPEGRGPSSAPAGRRPLPGCPQRMAARPAPRPPFVPARGGRSRPPSGAPGAAAPSSCPSRAGRDLCLRAAGSGWEGARRPEAAFRGAVSFPRARARPRPAARLSPAPGRVRRPGCRGVTCPGAGAGNDRFRG